MITFTGFDLKKSGINRYWLGGTFTLRGISRSQEFELIRHGAVTTVDKDLLCSRLTVQGAIKGSDFGTPDPDASAMIYLHASIQFEPWDKRDLSVFDILVPKSE